MTGTPVLSQRRATAHQDLLASIRSALDAGATVPCLGPHWDRWTSDDHQDTQDAAAACADCPVLTRCAAYATTAKERGAVWGGRVRRPAPHRRRETTTETTTTRSTP
ncbi:WhiB family transcriptional regulator [Kocuria sp. KH4]